MRSKVLFTGGGEVTPGLAISGSAAARFRIDTVTPSTAAPLAPGARVTVVIRFAPAGAARTLGRSASLQVTSDSPLVTVALTGGRLGGVDQLQRRERRTHVAPPPVKQTFRLLADSYIV